MDVSIQYVYWVKRAKPFKKLRVKIDGLTHFCGQSVKGMPSLFVQKIEACGRVTLQDTTGKQYHFENLKIKGRP